MDSDERDVFEGRRPRRPRRGSGMALDSDERDVFEEQPEEEGEFEEEAEEQEEQEVRYFIDADWYQETGISFSDIVAERMCPQCQRRLGEEIEERYPVPDPRTGRVTYELRQIKYGARPVAVIRDCCARKSGFITPDMTILEVVFRILLANGNQPMPLAHIRDQLREWCPHGRCQWLLVSIDAMRRIVDNDRFYGLRQHQLPEAA